MSRDSETDPASDARVRTREGVKPSPTDSAESDPDADGRGFGRPYRSKCHLCPRNVLLPMYPDCTDADAGSDPDSDSTRTRTRNQLQHAALPKPGYGVANRGAQGAALVAQLPLGFGARQAHAHGALQGHFPAQARRSVGQVGHRVHDPS